MGVVGNDVFLLKERMLMLRRSSGSSSGRVRGYIGGICFASHSSMALQHASAFSCRLPVGATPSCRHPALTTS